MPIWNPAQLTKHHLKRITKDKGCFEQLLGIVARDMNEQEYKLRSHVAFDNAWGEYEAESWNVRARDYYPTSAYFVDDDLVVAITDPFRREFQTCYHEHFGRPHGVDPGPGALLGQRKLRYRGHLKQEVLGKLIRKLKWIRNV